MAQVRVKLIGKLVAGATAAGSGGVATLDHEIRDHAVKRDAIVVTTAGEIEEIRAGDGSFGRIKRGIDIAGGGLKCDFDVGHGGEKTSDFGRWQQALLKTSLRDLTILRRKCRHYLVMQIITTALLAALLLSVSVTAAGPKIQIKNPDLAQGEPVPVEGKHTWTLGATGARGWMYSDKLTTTDARQIAITEVAKGSPSDGVLLTGDVVLGVGGKAFSYEPRAEFGKALGMAESKAGAGDLKITRWRAGKTEEVVVKLPVLGDYSATAPYDCPKSKRILELGCEALAKRMTKDDYANGQNPVTRSLNALVLLASGNPSYAPLVKREVEWASNYSATAMQTWYYGYVITLLAEYKMATGDESVMPGLRRLAMESALGQSKVGSWGHKFALPDGRLAGYGMMNAPGVPLTISLVLARSAGVKDPAIDLAIDRSTKLLRFYVGKGSVPYGDHAPWIQNHDDNGKNGMAAVLFDLLDEPEAAGFFARMSLACHGAERDTGHTGNFWNMTWAMPGVAQAGPNATGAWMREFGAWYYDLARGWNFEFPHQGPPQLNRDSTGGWDATGAYLLAYAMPLQKLHLTGKRASKTPKLSAAEAKQVVIDGQGWTNKDRTSTYDKFNIDELIKRLSHESPVVRDRAAMAIARRKDVPIDAFMKLLESNDHKARLGACEVLALFKAKAAPAVPALRRALQDKDYWLRIKAAEALAAIGKPAMPVLPELLEMIARAPASDDPRGMEQRYISSAIFGQMLKDSLDGVDRELLYKAVRAGLQNEDGRARGVISSVYSKLSYQEIEPLLPVIYQAVVIPSPSGEMFADGVRIEGLNVLAEHRIEEGIQACVDYARTQNLWSSQKRIIELMDILCRYGTRAKPMIPQLQQMADTISKGEAQFPMKLSQDKAQVIRETIRKIEAATDNPELIRLKS